MMDHTGHDTHVGHNGHTMDLGHNGNDEIMAMMGLGHNVYDEP